MKGLSVSIIIMGDTSPKLALLEQLLPSRLWDEHLPQKCHSQNVLSWKVTTSWILVIAIHSLWIIDLGT